MKFNQIKKGLDAVTKIDLPLVGVSGKEVNTVPVGLRILSPDETASCLAAAPEFAKKYGVSDPKPGDPLYEMGLRVHTVFLACVDVDHPEPRNADARFFASVDEILNAENIGRDGIWMLYEHQEAWQDACSPQPPKMTEGQFWHAVTVVAASDDPLVCEQWRPATRASFMRSMAQALLTSLSLKSDSGSPSDTGTTKKPKSSEKERRGRRKVAA